MSKFANQKSGGVVQEMNALGRATQTSRQFIADTHPVELSVFVLHVADAALVIERSGHRHTDPGERTCGHIHTVQERCECAEDLLGAGAVRDRRSLECNQGHVVGIEDARCDVATADVKHQDVFGVVHQFGLVLGPWYRYHITPEEALRPDPARFFWLRWYGYPVTFGMLFPALELDFRDGGATAGTTDHEFSRQYYA